MNALVGVVVYLVILSVNCLVSEMSYQRTGLPAKRP